MIKCQHDKANKCNILDSNGSYAYLPRDMRVTELRVHPFVEMVHLIGERRIDRRKGLLEFSFGCRGATLIRHCQRKRTCHTATVETVALHELTH